MDTNVKAVQDLLQSRMEVGFKKYGVTTERTDLTHLEWLQHLQEELLDAAVYIQKLKGLTNAIERVSNLVEDDSNLSEKHGTAVSGTGVDFRSWRSCRED